MVTRARSRAWSSLCAALRREPYIEKEPPFILVTVGNLYSYHLYSLHFYYSYHMMMTMMMSMMMLVIFMMAMAMGLVVMMLTFMNVATRLVVTARGAGRSQDKILMLPRARSGRHRPPMTAERQPRRCQEKTATTNRRDTRSTSGKTTATKQMCLDTRRHSSRVSPMMGARKRGNRKCDCREDGGSPLSPQLLLRLAPARAPSSSSLRHCHSHPPSKSSLPRSGPAHLASTIHRRPLSTAAPSAQPSAPRP